ncbi:MAG: hypothetical protein FWC42_07640 [Proteobacteria bacterium]|nr:hypothetical protein [Pseudomonadota bacterium]
MKKQIVAYAAFILGIFAPASSAIAEGGKILIKGTDTPSLRVLIRKVDDGPLLWVSKYQLGTETWVTPGPHKINAMCEFHRPVTGGDVGEIVPGNIEIDAKPGNTYHLTGSQEALKCLLKVEERAN